jgi:hypothetical protein
MWTCITDGTLTLDDLLAPGLPVLLVFSDPECGACAALAPHIGDRSVLTRTG